jgi:DNA-directed RNA polymerase specialized sigma24 family protein
MRTNPVPTDPTQAYTLAVYDEVLRIAGAARHGRDVLDIANNVAVTVLESSASIMQRFPRPEEYARACARNAGFSFDRAERVQRCEGVRLRTPADGTKVTGRTWVSGHATMGDGQHEAWSLIPDQHSWFEADTVDRLDAQQQYRACTNGIPQHELREVLEVDGYERPVADVAQACGQRRETVSRRINRVRERIREHRGSTANCQADRGGNRRHPRRRV